jgi:hypothetical protein
MCIKTPYDERNPELQDCLARFPNPDWHFGTADAMTPAGRLVGEALPDCQEIVFFFKNQRGGA